MHNTFSLIVPSLRRHAAIGLTATVIAGIGSLAFSVQTTTAEIYQYIGPNGAISLTNVPTDPRYRKIEIESSRFHTTLSERELEVLRLLAAGLSNNKIGEQLYISATTAKFHVSNIMRKLEVSRRAEAVYAASKRGLI